MSNKMHSQKHDTWTGHGQGMERRDGALAYVLSYCSAMCNNISPATMRHRYEDRDAFNRARLHADTPTMRVHKKDTLEVALELYKTQAKMSWCLS